MTTTSSFMSKLAPGAAPPAPSLRTSVVLIAASYVRDGSALAQALARAPADHTRRRGASRAYEVLRPRRPAGRGGRRPRASTPPACPAGLAIWPAWTRAAAIGRAPRGRISGRLGLIR